MPFLEALGIDVHYDEFGPAEADVTLIALHGMGVDNRCVIGVHEPLFADRPGWRRIYPDLPGMGRTPAPEWIRGTDDVFAVLRAFVDAVVPGRYAVSGGSYGGYLAAGLAAAEPERISGLALLVPMVLPPGQRDVAEHRVLYREPGVSAPHDSSVVVTATAVRRLEDEVHCSVVDDAAVARIAAHYAGSFPLTSTYAGPALIVTGRQDDALGYNDQWRQYGQLPRATHAVLDRGGHGLLIELSGLVTALLADWLDRVEQPAPTG
ncbi:alpha/beta fold hydrolase [Micromonospora sp. NPDC049799]|uniref:alpha/beta fold hydrolase n=1 Tax=Micromonospora sp. NPDC049799 TaxID=3154741 RepID=UPI0033D1680E